MNEKQKRLYDYFINNPCLSVEIDYESEKVREQHYMQTVLNLNNEDLEQYLKDYELTETKDKTMLILKMKKERGTDSFYKGMIGGMIIEITSNASEAKQFKDELEAIKEKEKYAVYLKNFEITIDI